MASDVLSLFNMPSQAELGQNYLQGMMSSPAQMGAQSLLQQVVSLGGNAGAGLGYGVGRLMGGMTAEEVRAKQIDDAMRTVQGLGLNSDAEMYGALSQELARRGLTQDALMARNAGMKAMQAEEQMRLARQQGDINLAEMGVKLDNAAREAESFPLQLEESKLKIAKYKEDRLVLEEQLAAALREKNTDRATGIQRQIDAKKAEADIEQRKMKVLERNAASTEVSSQASLLRAGQERVAGSIGAVPYTDLTGKLTMVPLGRGAGNKIIGSGTGASYTPEEWAASGAMKEEDALKKKLKIQEEDTGGGDKNKNKGKDMQSVLQGIYSGQTTQVTTPQTIEGYQARTGQPIREPGESGAAYRDRVLAWDRARQEELNRQRLIQEEALRQQRLQQGTSMLSNRPLVQ